MPVRREESDVRVGGEHEARDGWARVALRSSRTLEPRSLFVGVKQDRARPNVRYVYVRVGVQRRGRLGA